MQETTLLSRHYYSIETLPLSLFWDICVSGDKKLLIIEGDVPDETLEIDWENIIYEYTDIVSPETNRKIKNRKRIAILQAKYDCVYSGLHLLKAYAAFELNDERVELQQKICNVIASFFPGIKIDYNNQKTLLQKLKTVEAKTKNWVVTINELKKQNKEDAGVERQARRIDFQNMLTACNVFHKLTFKPSDLTVLEFATYYKRMIEEIEQQKISIANNGRIRKH